MTKKDKKVSGRLPPNTINHKRIMLYTVITEYQRVTEIHLITNRRSQAIHKKNDLVDKYELWDIETQGSTQGEDIDTVRIDKHILNKELD